MAWPGVHRLHVLCSATSFRVFSSQSVLAQGGGSVQAPLKRGERRFHLRLPGGSVGVTHPPGLVNCLQGQFPADLAGTWQEEGPHGGVFRRRWAPAPGDTRTAVGAVAAAWREGGLPSHFLTLPPVLSAHLIHREPPSLKAFATGTRWHAWW